MTRRFTIHDSQFFEFTVTSDRLLSSAASTNHERVLNTRKCEASMLLVVTTVQSRLGQIGLAHVEAESSFSVTYLTVDQRFVLNGNQLQQRGESTLCGERRT